LTTGGGCLDVRKGEDKDDCDRYFTSDTR
jgi:hypothetical protein